MLGFVFVFVESHSRAGQKRLPPHLIQDGSPHTAQGKVFKLKTFGRVKRSGGFDQANHAHLNQFIQFHERRQARFQVHRHAFDHGHVRQNHGLVLVTNLFVQRDVAVHAHHPFEGTRSMRSMKNCMRPEAV